MSAMSILANFFSVQRWPPMANPAFVLDRTVALDRHLSFDLVVHYCRQGRFVGVYFDRTSWHWRIPCPVRFR